MVVKCSVKGCQTERYPGNPISLHSFPKNEELYKMWCDVVPLRGKLTKNSMVCGLHFEPDDYTKGPGVYPALKKTLKPGAVPTIFINFNEKSLSKRYGIDSEATANLIASLNASPPKSASDADSASSESSFLVMFDSSNGTTLVNSSPVELEPSSKLRSPLNKEEKPSSECQKCTKDLGPENNNLKIRLKEIQRKNRKLVQTNRRLREKVKTLQDVLKKLSEKSRYIKTAKKHSRNS